MAAATMFCGASCLQSLLGQVVLAAEFEYLACKIRIQHGLLGKNFQIASASAGAFLNRHHLQDSD